MDITQRLDSTGTDPATSNELAAIVIDVFGDDYVPLDIRYGIAYAIQRAGYIKGPGPTRA
jgi:hypothetical protein